MSKIITSFVYPPIPIRTMDWCAYVDGEEEGGRYGWGETEEEAKQDLLDQLEEEDMNENDVRKANGSKTLITLIMIKDHLRDQHVQANLFRMGAFGAHSVQRAIELLNELIFEEQKKSQ